MKSGKKWILLYFVLMIVAQLYYLPLYYLGADLRTPSKAMMILAVFLLLVGVFKYHWGQSRVEGRGLYHAKPWIFLVTVGLLLFYGWARGNLTYNVCMEAAGYGLIFLFLIVGQHDQFWLEMERPLIVLFWISLGFVVIGLQFPVSTTDLSLSFLEVAWRPRQKTVGYIIQTSLHLWPLLFSLSYLRPKFDKWKILGIGTLLAYVALSIYFEKRAHLARSLAYAASILVFVPLLQKRLRPGTAAVMLLLLGALLAVTVSSARFQELLSRYQERDVKNFRNSPRAEEAKGMMGELSGAELLFGRGMGGYYTSIQWSTGNSVVNSQGTRARLSCHIGAVVPILKGGLFFLLLHILFYLPLILPKGRGWYRNRINTAVMAVAPVYLAFQLVESSPTFLTYMDVALVGLMWSRLGRKVQPADVPETAEYYILEDSTYGYVPVDPGMGHVQHSLSGRRW